MANILYRESTTPTTPGSTTAKGTPLSNLEVDGNLKSINDDLITRATTGANTFTGAQNTAYATVASHATTADIWAAAGNIISWTGTAITTAFPNAPQAGSERILICAGLSSFTAGANLLIDGIASGNTFACAVNDRVTVTAVSTTQFRLSIDKYNGAPVSLNGFNGLPAMRPSLLLDFANSQQVDSRITFTRASTAQRTNVFGLLESVAVNTPRIDYDPVTGACKGLLIEEARTNLLTYSEQFDNAAWGTPTNATISANSVAAPDGATTADSLVELIATGLHAQDTTAVGFVTSTVYTLSIFVKPIGSARAILGFPVTVFTDRFARFNLTGSGSVVSVDGAMSATIQQLNDGWFRISATSPCVSGAFSRATIFISNSANDVSYTGDGTSGLYLWGAQLEAGGFPTSYIPTTSAAATRAADVATMTGVNFSSWYRQSEGALIVRARVPGFAGIGNAGNIIHVSDGTNNNVIALRILGETAGADLFIATGGVSQVDTNEQSVAVNTRFIIAAGYKINDFAISVTGSAAITDVVGTIPTLTQMQLGASGSAWIEGISYYPKRVSNAELQGLSS